MKVGLYTVSLFRQVTGIEKVGIFLADALIAHGHSVVWITPPGPNPPLESLPAGVSVEFLPYGITPEHVDRVKAIAEQCNLDVIVAMTTNGVASIFPLALRGLNTAFVFSEHNQPDFYVKQWWGIGKDFSAKMAMRDALINAANKVHVLRASCAPEELVAANKVHVIPNAVEPTQLRASPPVDHRPIKFISIGRLSPEKGLQDAILAFEILKDKIPEWEYKIFGDGPLLSELEALTKRLRLSGRIKFMGHTSTPLHSLAESHLLLMPSKFEGWPLVAGEAQSVGLPIIGFRDCDSLSEAFGPSSGAQLLNARSPLALAEEMHHIVCDHQHWHQLSENGLEASRRRTPQIISAQWIELLQCAVNEKNRRSQNDTETSRALELLKSEIVSDPYSESNPSPQDHDPFNVLTVVKSRLKSASRHFKDRVKPAAFKYGKVALRSFSRLQAPSGITLYTLPGIEDGPKYLQEHLSRQSHVVYQSPAQRLGPQEYLRLLKSRIVVTEGGFPRAYRTQQKVVQIWHSSGFIKRAANLHYGLPTSKFKEEVGDFDFVIAPSEAMVSLYAEAFCVPEEYVLPLGSLKTDPICNSVQKQRMKEEALSQSPALRGKRIYVYAPTFRGRWPDCLYHYSSVKLDELNEALSEDERLIISLHPSLACSPPSERQRRTNLMPQRHHHKIIDAQAFNLSSLHALAAADVFISDYSGGLLDAVASGIPTLCFADDLDHYRPYLTDGFIDEVPCLVTERGTGAFIDGIKKAVGSCDESVKAFRNRWVGASDGKAGTRVADLLERL